MKKNRIIQGDTIKELKKMQSESIDLIFADPPYWMRVDGVMKRYEGTHFDGCYDTWDQFDELGDYEKFTNEWLNECYRVLKPNGSIWVIGSMQCIYIVGAIMQTIGFWLINDVVWHKKNPTPNFKGTRLNNSHETLIWATKSQKSKFTFHYKTAKELNHDTVTEEEYNRGIRKQLGSVWRIGICQGEERLKDENGIKLHSTQKPEELLYRILAISSNIGDLVLDPFGGTMTTGAVAKRMGRDYIMIERERKYVEYGKKRLKKVTPSITNIEQATYDIKPLKVTMEEMIENGYFVEGEHLYLKDNKTEAILLKNGKLMYKGERMDMHSCAAIVRGVKAKRLNGFDYWYVKRGDVLVGIGQIREQFREDKKNSNKI